jgi:hypothetical protein
MKSARWEIVAGITVIVGALLLVLDKTFGIPNAVGYQHTSLEEILARRDFDGETWRKAAHSNDPVRLKMVDALLRKAHLVGKRRSEIEALLGPPDERRHLGYDYTYWLGPERGFFSIDYEWLGIKFKNDTVIEAKDVRD